MNYKYREQLSPEQICAITRLQSELLEESGHRV
jgi:hypothetical protein